MTCWAQRQEREAETRAAIRRLTLDGLVAEARRRRSPAWQAQERARRTKALAFELGNLATSTGAATDADLRSRWPDLDTLLPEARRLAARLFPAFSEAA